MSSEPFPGQVPDHRYETLGYLPWMARGKNDPFPMSPRVASTGVTPPQGRFHYGMMKPSREDAMRGAERYLGKEKVSFDVDLVANYIKLMYPELKGSCHPVDLDEVLINPQGTAGPSFRGMKMDDAIRAHPRLIEIPHYRCGSKILYKMSPKYEILPVEKLDTGTPRTFAFVDFHHKIRWTRLTQDFNQHIQTLKWRRPVAGSISLVDDWDRFWQAIDRFVYKIINDFRKFDSGYASKMHSVMYEIRKWAMDSSVSKEYLDELKYYYDSLGNIVCILPNGQVVRLHNGQISGQPSTTTDNSIIASFILDLAFSVIAWSQELGKPITPELLEYALRNRHPSCATKCILKTGGDDSTSGTDLDPSLYKEALDLCAKTYGFEVKLEDFGVFTDVTKCGFLGGRATKVGGRFVYTPKDPRKMFESMFLQKSKLSVEEEYNKLLSLCALLWNTSLFLKGYEVYEAFYMQESRLTRLAPPLTRDDIAAFWLGRETTGRTRQQSCALSVRSLLGVAAAGVFTFSELLPLSAIAQAGPEMKNNTKAKAKKVTETVKQAVKAEAKKEAHKEVVKEIHALEKAVVNHPPKKNHQRKKVGAFGNGIHTYVLGTGVQTPIAELTQHPTKVLSSDGRECEYTCTDRVGEVTITSEDLVGNMLLELPLAPALIPVTRLGVEAQNWEKFMVESWAFLFITTQGTETSGQIIAFVDPDPRDSWEDDGFNVNRAAAQFGAVPINVWQHFATRLPVGRDTSTTSYYTNPVTSSDVRFTQPGVLRVINCGGWGVLPSGGKTVFSVYQRVKLRFMDPELDVTTAAARPIAVITDNTVRGTTVGAPLVTPSAEIRTGIPVTIQTDGSVNIDTSSIGNNNLVVEMEAQVENLSDVETTVGIDPQGESFLDQATSTIRAVFRADNTLAGQAFAAAHAVLVGRQSWNLQALLLGAASVAVRQVVMKFWVVPGNVRNLERAAKITGIKYGRKIPNRVKAAEYVPPAWYNSTTVSVYDHLTIDQPWPGSGATVGCLGQGWGHNGGTSYWKFFGFNPSLQYGVLDEDASMAWTVSSITTVYRISVEMYISVDNVGSSTYDLHWGDGTNLIPKHSNTSWNVLFFDSHKFDATTWRITYTLELIPLTLGIATFHLDDLWLDVGEQVGTPTYTVQTHVEVVTHDGAAAVASSKARAEQLAKHKCSTSDDEEEFTKVKSVTRVSGKTKLRQ